MTTRARHGFLLTAAVDDETHSYSLLRSPALSQYLHMTSCSMAAQPSWRSSLQREMDVALASIESPRLLSLLGGRENDDELQLPAVYVAGVRSAEQVQMCPLLGGSTPSERGAPCLEVTVPVKVRTVATLRGGGRQLERAADERPGAQVPTSIPLYA